MRGHSKERVANTHTQSKTFFFKNGAGLGEGKTKRRGRKLNTKNTFFFFVLKSYTGFGRAKQDEIRQDKKKSPTIMTLKRTFEALIKTQVEVIY